MALIEPRATSYDKNRFPNKNKFELDANSEYLLNEFDVWRKLVGNELKTLGEFINSLVTDANSDQRIKPALSDEATQAEGYREWLVIDDRLHGYIIDTGVWREEFTTAAGGSSSEVKEQRIDFGDGTATTFTLTTTIQKPRSIEIEHNVTHNRVMVNTVADPPGIVVVGPFATAPGDNEYALHLTGI